LLAIRVGAIFRGFMGRAFLLTLQFDGTDYCGWQRQREGRSVQAEVERVLSRLAGVAVGATAAGRTDAGVHALGLPVSATMPDRWTAAELLRAANALLPDSVAVSEVRAVRPGTDARRNAAGRRYRYDVGTDGDSRSPFRRRTEWPLGRPLPLGALERAAGVLPGEHDFRAFAAVGEPKPHYRCAVLEAAWHEIGPGRLRFTVAADRFLHHMVRFLVGTMVDVGLGRREESDMAMLLTRTDNHATSPPAPAAGLTFVAAWYPEDIWLDEAATW
jgi:tRNA pseudouridine38-40 synthase